MAGNDIVNSGVIEAGNRLDLLAGNNIVNRAGGIISGRDVSLTTVLGDVINERSVTNHIGYTGNRTDYLDSAARIEAANDMSINAGRDFISEGGALQSGRDTSIQAGRDVLLDSAETISSSAYGRTTSQTITQNGSTVTAGRDFSAVAGRDFTAIASQVGAQRDIDITTTGDLTLTSAANEEHFFSQSKKVTQSQDRITQVSTTLKAGGDIALNASQDLLVSASRIEGGGNVDLDAARDLLITSDQDESASFYQKKSKGSFGRSKLTQQESYHSTNIESVVTAGNDLTINASKGENGGINLDGGRDVTVIGSELRAGNDLLIGATGDVAVLSGIEEHGEYSKKTKSGFLGLSKSGKSQLQTSATQVGSELEAGNDIVLVAGSDLRLRASEASAGKDVELRAGLVDKDGDIDLLAANDTAYSRTEEYKKKIGLSLSPDFILPPSVSIASAKAAGKEAQSSTSVGSQVVAEQDATLKAERDVNLVGSGVSAGRNVSINAGRDVNVAAAESQRDERQWSSSSNTGLRFDSDDNGISFFAGVEKEKAKDRLYEQSASGSQVQAGQDLNVNAGRDINQSGSDLKAGHDINLAAGRDINIDAAGETRVEEHEREFASQGAGGSINHNLGRTKDAVSNAGNGENNVSKGSSTLQAVDAVSQFFAGPTGDGKLGNTTQSSSQQTVEQGNRASTLDAGNDITFTAGNNVNVAGSQLQAGRDITIKGRDINIDVAHGGTSQQTSESQSWGGIHGGSSGGFKVGIGGSHGTASTDGNQGNSTASQLDAGRDIKLEAGNDLNVIGSQVQAGRDIDLAAGKDINIRAAQNDSEHEQNRASGGGEVGLAFGSEGVGIYASVNLGRGHLEREAQRHQEAYLYAGDQLKFTSGKDTTISGAQVRGDEVIGRVGGDLKVSSAIDTGEVKGKEFDVSVTVTIGPGAGVSGSVGYGQTTGKTEWVENQTRVTGASKVDIRTQDHTQIDGALIAADNGNLKLDTDTLGYSDIAGSDKEHGYYLNVGGSWKQGGGSTQQDPSQEGKGKKGENGWSVSGWEYEKEREQIVRATVGEGEIVVREDAATGQDSTAGLNRDLDKAYEITRDHEERTDLYVTDSSLDDVMNPGETLKEWATGFVNYSKTAQQNYEQAGNVVNTLVNRYERMTGRPMDSGAVAIAGKQLAEETQEALILAGVSRDKAKALMGDEQFQQQVLLQLKNLEGIFQQSQKIAGELEGAGGIYQLPVTPVEGERNLLQWTGTYASNIAGYIDQHPNEGEAVALALAMIQGPKAIIQLAVGSVISETQAGQEVGKYVDVARTFLGKTVAEHLEGNSLNGGESDGSDFLIGGGKLIVDVLLGAVPTSRGGKTNTAPTVDKGKAPSEHIAQNSKGSDLPNKQPDKPASGRDPCCFAAGTMVATPEGDRAIETLTVGDIVWTKPEHGGKPFAAAILKTYQRNDQPIYKLTLESTRTDGEVKQETLFVTPSHPFYVPARRDFVPMIQLKMGELLQSLDDGAGEGTSSRVASVELYKPVGETFNLTVDIGHTFYVGELKTWVHNEGPCDINGGPKKQDASPGTENEGSNADDNGAKGEVSGLLPKPGATSIPASGVGAGAEFKVDSKQLGKKLGKHVEDFGGNAASPADRKMVLDKIHDVGSNPEKVIPGTFAGQGANGARGDVFFRVKGNDVVVTKPDGTFVTILKDGVTQNPSVQSALKGGVR